MTTPLLHLEGVSVSYGPVQALQEITLDVPAGEVVALLGANGAGKSSLLRAISRLVPLSGGTIHFAGEAIDTLRPSAVVERRLAHCPEGRRIFPEMTVAENLAIGAYLNGAPDRVRRNLDRAFHYFPVLAERRTQKGGTLSGGEQQMLAVARALMSEPRLLMLDEPSLGLAPLLIEQIFRIISTINREEGVTVFLVEQNANEALLHAHHAYVLENGHIALAGEAEALRQDPRVREAYLGV